MVCLLRRSMRVAFVVVFLLPPWYVLRTRSREITSARRARNEQGRRRLSRGVVDAGGFVQDGAQGGTMTLGISHANFFF